jgi:hypothetical protein
MTLDEAKRRITLRTVPGHLLEMDDTATEPEAIEEQEELQEGKKRPHTPKFVQHCVTAITEKPESLSRVKREAPKGSDGSPFAICWAQYKKKRRSLAAKHSKGEHHTVKEYKGALKTLRQETEEIRRARPSRSAIIFEAAGPDAIERTDRSRIRFQPEG